MELFESPKTKAGRFVGSAIRIGIGVAGVVLYLKGNGAIISGIPGEFGSQIATQAGNIAGQATDVVLEAGGLLGAGISLLWSWKNIKNTVKIK